MSGLPSEYERIGRLGEGGMGHVDLVARRGSGFKRLYAMKRLRADMRAQPAVRAMLADEARLAGLLQHPNVVGVTDIGEDQDGPFIVMDYVDGFSMGQVLSWAAARQMRLPVQFVVRLLRQAADGLHAAHELRSTRGTPLALIHRDISPQNLLVGFDGMVRVSDFGIAKAADTRHTNTGLLKGKVGYMSPEQLRFEPIDRRADLFALGVVLYEALTTRRLYSGDNATEIARRILHEPPPDIEERRRDVPPAIVELLFQLLAKDPEDRPASAAEVSARLEAVAAELSLQEGVLRPDAFLEENFAQERAATRAQLEAKTVPIALQFPGTEDSVRLSSAEPRRRAVGVGLVGFAGAAIVAVAFALWQQRPDPSNEGSFDAAPPVAITASPGAPPVQLQPGRAQAAPGPPAPAAQASEKSLATDEPNEVDGTLARTSPAIGSPGDAAPEQVAREARRSEAKPQRPSEPEVSARKKRRRRGNTRGPNHRASNAEPADSPRTLVDWGAL